MNLSCYYLVLFVLALGGVDRLSGVDGINIGRLINYFFDGLGRQDNGNVVHKWGYLPAHNGINQYQINAALAYTPSEFGKKLNEISKWFERKCWFRSQFSYRLAKVPEFLIIFYEIRVDLTSTSSPKQNSNLISA